MDPSVIFWLAFKAGSIRASDNKARVTSDNSLALAIYMGSYFL